MRAGRMKVQFRDNSRAGGQSLHQELENQPENQIVGSRNQTRHVYRHHRRKTFHRRLIAWTVRDPQLGPCSSGLGRTDREFDKTSSCLGSCAYTDSHLCLRPLLQSLSTRSMPSELNANSQLWLLRMGGESDEVTMPHTNCFGMTARPTTCSTSQRMAAFVFTCILFLICDLFTGCNLHPAQEPGSPDSW